MIFFARATRGPLKGPRWTRAVEAQSALIPSGDGEQAWKEQSKCRH